MKTVSMNVYSFSELSEDAKSVASVYIFENYTDDWYEGVFENAKLFGVKITGFDLRRRSISGEFIDGIERVIDEIKKSKNDDLCKIVDWYEGEVEKLDQKLITDESYTDSEYEEDLISLEKEFLYSVLEVFLVVLDREYEYVHSEEFAMEIAEANDLLFYEDGRVAWV